MHKKVYIDKSWLFTAVVILFLSQIIAFSFAVGNTYSGRSENPNHTLTYSKKKLVWDTATNIDGQGVAELTPFDAEYTNVKSENRDNVVAPGTSGSNIIRLKNDSGHKISYKAVLYAIKTDDDVSVKATLSEGNFSDTAEPVLPNGIEKGTVIRSVKGDLGSKQQQDFDITWLWNHYDSDLQDKIDTQFGDQAAYGSADIIKVGFYVVVEEDGSYISPIFPKTGEKTIINRIIVCFVIDAIFLMIIIMLRRRVQN